MRVILLNMVLGSVSFGCVRCLRYMLARRVCRLQLLPRRVDGICGRGPKLALGEESAPRRGAKRIPGRIACVRRAGLQVARHAERETERQTGREPTCSIDLSWHEIAESRSGQRCRPWNPEARTTRQVRHEALPHGPISRLRHGSPDVGGTFGRTGIAGEIVVFEGTFDPVVAHAVRESSDTERDVRRSRAVGIFSRGPEPLQRQEPPSPSGRKRSLLPAHLSLLLLFLMQFGDLFVKSFSLRVLQPGMAGEPNER